MSVRSRRHDAAEDWNRGTTLRIGLASAACGAPPGSGCGSELSDVLPCQGQGLSEFIFRGGGEEDVSASAATPCSGFSGEGLGTIGDESLLLRGRELDHSGLEVGM